MTVKFFYEAKLPTSTAQQRQFFGNGKSALPASAKKARAFWIALMEKYKPEKPLEGPVQIEVIFTWERKNQKTEEPKITRPDLDNLSKLVLDAMVKAEYFKDDSQVVKLDLQKYWGSIGGVYIKVKEAR